MTFDTLPLEIHDSIASFISAASGLNALSRTCRQYQAIYEHHLYRNNAQHNSSSAMIWAAEKGVLNTILKSSKHGGNFNAIDDYERSPLVMAASNNHEDIVRLLLDEGCDPLGKSTRLGRETTPFCEAIEAGHPAIVRQMLDRGVHPDSLGKFNDSSLTAAVGNNNYPGNLNIINLLLERGANINITDGRSSRPLTRAVFMSYLGIAQFLVEKGADIELEDGFGRTPLLITTSLYYEDVQMVQFLLDQGANVERHNRYGTRALMEAARFAHERTIQLLLEAGADVLATDNRGETALDYAAFHGYEAVGRLLLDWGTELRKSQKAARKALGRALGKAASSGHEGFVKMLLEYGADPDIRCGRYLKPLLKAILSNEGDVVKLLLEAGAGTKVGKPKFGGNNGLNAFELWFAVDEGRESIVRLLLEHGASMRFKERDRWTPLHTAAKRDFPEIATILLEYGHEVDAFGLKTRTPLWTATWYNSPNVAKVLLEAGANPKHPGCPRYGTPYHLSLTQRQATKVGDMVRDAVDAAKDKAS